ncbi:MAG: hypothetical protein JSS60_04860 [Verrucomicrobia bacterium]|nr:hypothetical protein [Verrucomicrobiota bacterium]
MNKRSNLRLFLLIPCLLGGLFYFTSTFCNKMTDGFSVARIHSDLSFNPQWETAPLSTEGQKELELVFSQRFHYLGCGGQCFAFGSDDGNYVIKFFKHKIRKPYSYLLQNSLPGPLDEKRKRKLNKALLKLNRDFTSYKIAYEELADETGLIYIHLNKGTSLNRSVFIVDKIGIEHRIPLDDIEFVVQRQAQLVHDRIEELMQKDDIPGAKRALHAILSVIVSRCQKGVFDEDPRIHRNFGFLGDKSIFIDVGRFIRDPARKDPAVYQKDLLQITKRFRCWLQETHPELVATLDEELNEYQSKG